MNDVSIHHGHDCSTLQLIRAPSKTRLYEIYVINCTDCVESARLGRFLKSAATLAPG